uniref:Uncharacterized protein n=1 Tax=Sipha flava TaxID=143950 RepID=A0A2S2QR84_9HEMI
MVFIFETAALIGATANWMFTYYGMSITGVNGLYDVDTNVPYHQHEILTMATNSLVMSTYASEWQPYVERDLLHDLRVVAGVNNLQYNDWISLTLPWWFVQAVSEKMGLVYKVNQKEREVWTIPGRVGNGWHQGYPINENSMWATLSILTSDDRYIEHNRYTVLGNGDNGYDQNTWAAWKSDSVMDHFAQVQTMPVGTPADRGVLSHVNLLTLPYIQDNTKKDEKGPIFFVSSSTPNRTTDWMRCQNPLRYPDPIRDHLIRAGKAAIPELMVGNVPGAIKTALLSMADPALNRTLNKVADISGLDLFRPGGPP